MLIGRRHKLESDSMNITLSEKHKSKKDGGSYWRAVGYYSTPAEALKGLVDTAVRETSLTDLKTVVKKQEELYKLISKLKV